jgi:hypothetical protein
VTRGWRKLHNEELHNLYSSPSIYRMIKSRRMRRAGHVPRMEEKRNAYRILVGKPEGMRPLGRPRHRWVDNINRSVLYAVHNTPAVSVTCRRTTYMARALQR